MASSGCAGFDASAHGAQLRSMVDSLDQPEAEVFAGHVPLMFGEACIGHLSPAFSAYVLARRSLIALRDGLLWIDPLRPPPELSARWHELAVMCRTDGWLPAWRDEAYAVRHPAHGEPICELERGAFRRFGLKSEAVHVNGISHDGRIWVARRAASKAIDPGRLDNMVGGGIASGEDATSALLRECQEEAGVPLAVARGAHFTERRVSLRREPDGIHHETLHIYDLLLPVDFMPRNLDGEVAGFSLMSPDAVTEALCGGAFTIDAGAVTAACLLRHSGS